MALATPASIDPFHHIVAHRMALQEHEASFFFFFSIPTEQQYGLGDPQINSTQGSPDLQKLQTQLDVGHYEALNPSSSTTRQNRH